MNARYDARAVGRIDHSAEPFIWKGCSSIVGKPSCSPKIPHDDLNTLRISPERGGRQQA